MGILMSRSDFMTLSTSVAGNSSAANVYFSNDGLDIYFFTFNPTRKAVQIAFNPKVQCVIRPDGEDGIKELQIDGFAKKITDVEEKDKAREAILKVTKAFSEYMHDDFLIANDVVGYYKIEPTVIKYVDFFAETQFEWIEIPENKPIGTATIIAINAIKAVPANNGTEPNAFFKSAYSSAVMVEASLTNARCGLHEVPNKKSKILITEKNLILSNNRANIIPIVVKMVYIMMMAFLKTLSPLTLLKN